MKFKILLVGGLLLIIVILSLGKSSPTSSDIVSDDEIVYEEKIKVEYTSNLFSILGQNLANFIEKCFSLVFIVINKILEFAFGI